MQPLFTLVAHYAYVREQYREEIIGAAVEYSQSLPNGAGQVTQNLATLAPTILGTQQLNLALLLAYGVEETACLELGLNREFGDIVAAIELSHEVGVSVHEIFLA